MSDMEDENTSKMIELMNETIISHYRASGEEAILLLGMEVEAANLSMVNGVREDSLYFFLIFLDL
ncbi:hypothetical protein LR48_Vigan598s001400 [Vigna angularis]|uniref:Uncharacterized protein n=1 Tax=Phaseolus angularis TaxID=3914 RepID=A0A0L9TE82_PHAAN|nr:hypothetical protein LR48_Vigan598s001400 [Vigna angularis]